MIDCILLADMGWLYMNDEKITIVFWAFSMTVTIIFVMVTLVKLAWESLRCW